MISVKGLQLTAYHGVMEQERQVGNLFEVDLSLDVPLADRAMHSDELDDTVSYAEVVDIVKREMAVPSRLLEHVTGRIVRALCKKYDGLVMSGSVEVKKLAPPIPGQMDYVSYKYTW